MNQVFRPVRGAAILSLLATFAVASSACGGGGGGPGPSGAGQGLVLVNFLQGGVDNLALNTILEFRFSEAVKQTSVSAASLQIRSGTAFGLTVPGIFRVVDSVVFFEPRLPGLCDFSDSGFKPDTQYRVSLVGYPENFRIENTQGQPLGATLTFEFHTRTDIDPLLFTDQVAATSPSVVTTSPANGTPVVQVLAGNQVVIDLSENLKPCTVNDTTVFFHEYQRGDPTRFDTTTTPPAASHLASGFLPVVDSDGSPFSWGPLDAGETNLATPQKVRATITLTQDFGTTRITLTPEFGQFPENSLLVVRLTFGIQDFGGSGLVPFAFSFTTENKSTQTGNRVIEFLGETPILTALTTADVNTARAPSLAQGYLLFAGDGDNGAILLTPSLPKTQATGCTVVFQANDQIKDDFDPATDAAGVLDTGAFNNCVNTTDGSTAVIWEFRTFRVRSGVTVRIKGSNPAIILVQGDVVVETGGRILARGDGNNTVPNSVGGAGATTNLSTVVLGGIGVSGAGDGGQANATTGAAAAQDGKAGFGSPQQFVFGGTGAGQGNTSAKANTFSGNGSSPAGGGGGHSLAGLNGGAVQPAADPATPPVLGVGGATYPTVGTALAIRQMRKPSAGAGGGGAGYNVGNTFTSTGTKGGAGGAGGGFVDITSSGNISVFGTVDAAGSRGGAGASGFYVGSGGGGGGAGGGIRFLTPGAINVTGATITAAGGAGGGGVLPQFNIGAGAVANNGGAGGVGRVVFEDSDSVITGLAGATVVPAEGAPGFYRGPFDATRFQGGGLEPQAVTGVFFVGPANPKYSAFVPATADFIAGIPAITNRGPSSTGIRIEARGFNLLPDGTADVSVPPLYRTVGFFKYDGVPLSPTWVIGQPADVGPLPADNSGVVGIGGWDGSEFLQIRITFFLPATAGPFDAGPFLDRWQINFTYDQ